DAVARPRDDRQKDLLRPALEEIIDLGHPLVRLAREIDWGFLDRRFASVCTPGPAWPGLPTRLVAGLFILKQMHNLSDEVLCVRWLENPYYQFFCSELSFCHRLPFDRSSLMHWRQRLGQAQPVLIQESLSVAHKTGALATRDLERVVADTTVQPKAIAHPTDARLCHGALEKTGRTGAAPSRAIAAELPARRQACRNHGRALHACPPVQAGPARAQAPAHSARPRDPRYPPQDRRQRGAPGTLRQLARAGGTGALSGSPAARSQSLCAACPEVECIGKGKARGIRVRLQGLGGDPG